MFCQRAGDDGSLVRQPHGSGRVGWERATLPSLCIRPAAEVEISSSGRMCPSLRIRSVEGMNIAIFLMLLAPALVSSIVAAVNAPKLNAQYRERRDAKRATHGATV